MKIRINLRNRKIRDFRSTWIRTLGTLGLISGDPIRDYGVIGEIIINHPYVYLVAPDLPFEVLDILKEYFKPNNIDVYEE